MGRKSRHKHPKQRRRGPGAAELPRFGVLVVGGLQREWGQLQRSGNRPEEIQPQEQGTGQRGCKPAKIGLFNTRSSGQRETPPLPFTKDSETESSSEDSDNGQQTVPIAWTVAATRTQLQTLVNHQCIVERELNWMAAQCC
ncbi:hypothetical protein NDU88_001845 [Pleurodeles waltl]|uniref:Uncharacterized protein n=1 Tax=Pleurodeles waltl TaxID=8319 RepID=A0AAV7SDY9_PLEWA|nr:hypothetical protein NDU88_001845 [Pleurodeles waltl]